MPIYAYRCESCGHAKDVLQKISDPVLSTCPSCQAPSFRKQLTAAGFQLKGSGWYATDFRGGNAPAKPDAAPPADGAATEAPKTDSTTPAAPAPAAAGGDSTPAAGSGTSCASH
ncbi:MAG TPA: FmdB family zinc ribbon protein [Albitalea sp.]|jgi:putative FmdB family regulatory protein|nr:FmdB family zinc ribbon protein [Albitalea sp.]